MRVVAGESKGRHLEKSASWDQGHFRVSGSKGENR